MNANPRDAGAREADRDADAAADPITLEVVRNKLEGIANEMQMTLLHSAFSPIVKEGMDCSASLFTADALVPGDSVPGSISPIPLAAPSFAMRLRYKSSENPNGWEWLASNFYINDFRPTS